HGWARRLPGAASRPRPRSRPGHPAHRPRPGVRHRAGLQRRSRRLRGQAVQPPRPRVARRRRPPAEQCVSSAWWSPRAAMSRAQDAFSGVTAQVRVLVLGVVLLVAVAGLAGLTGVAVATSTVNTLAD